ncbi:B3/B4 domain-containing protein [Spirosoma fluviale]|uniref:B3/B4 domain-containing protein (DNA/RNA-binding domain of Phe-tRNA-synthetase) n=1 Tax=Spirosoma fluviale TaxID=1597977 RepID=A0A286GTS7_9BACT|nr:phenylalanine--tRNA ligase beta subunit-related protein [Spirosoma fluviale]SOD98499.1 B3/B4 domain-containing protein (DNA/RNA-binding domain of Phe-tRNA-synthetase) [Spirosoma fluviale]
MNQSQIIPDITISAEVWQQFPNLRIGYIAGYGLDNTQGSDDLCALCQSAESALRSRFGAVDSLALEPSITGWRQVYRAIGAKPTTFTPTVEALLKRILKGNPMPIINKAVNAYLIAEMESLVPLGGYDLDTISGPIQLTKTTSPSPFIGFGGSVVETMVGELVYRDDRSVLTRHWNYRDALHSQITENTQRLILMAEAPDLATSDDVLSQTLHRVETLLKTYCGGTYQIGIWRNETD